MTICFKSAVNMEDKHPLNLDEFHLCVKLPLVFNYAPAGMDLITKYQIMVVSYFYFSATFSSLP